MASARACAARCASVLMSVNRDCYQLAGLSVAAHQGGDFVPGVESGVRLETVPALRVHIQIFAAGQNDLGRVHFRFL